MRSTNISRAHRAIAASAALLRDGDAGAITRRIRGLFLQKSPLLRSDLSPLVRGRGASQAAADGSLLMISSSLQRDGAPMSHLELATALKSRGWKIRCAAPADGPLAEAYIRCGVDVETWPELAVDSAVPQWYERSIEKLAARLAAGRPNAIFASTVDMFPAIDAARVVGVESVWNIRESEPWRERLADRHPQVAARALACFSYPTSVIFAARAAARSWAAFVDPSCARVIFNAYSGDAPPIATRGDVENDQILEILTIGRICERKGQIDLPAALARLPAAVRSRIRVRLVGDADKIYAAKVKRAAENLSVDGALQFDGVRDDVPQLLAAAAFVVHCARSEAFPRVLIEAAAMGTPIIAARAGDIEERLTDGESAQLYDAGDSAGLAYAIERFSRNAEFAARLAKNARAALIDNWRPDDMIDAYERELRKAARIDNRKAEAKRV